MESKFVNLKKEYRDFIENLAKEIRLLDISENLSKKKWVDIYKLYQDTYNSINVDTSNINVNDINHIILNYNKENLDVNAVKNFIRVKNLYMIQQITQSTLWKPFITKLQNSINVQDITATEIQLFELIEKGVYRLLKSSIDQFRGCWEIAEFKDNKLKKLDILEPEYLEFIINYVRQKINIKSNSSSIIT